MPRSVIVQACLHLSWPALAVMVSGFAVAQTPPRRGAAFPSVPGAAAKGAAEAAPSAPLSRSELLRRFDLNFDGTIDEAEGQLGRAKMRREREEEEQRRKSEEEIDPVTGRPRGEANKGKQPEAAKRRIISIDDLLPPNADATDGTDAEREAAEGSPERAPREGDPEAAAATATGRARNGAIFGGSGAAKGSTGKAPPATGSGRPGAISGGVRAGAPPARPGYGAPSSAKPDGAAKTTRPLNAGRPRGSTLPGASAARPNAPAATAPGARPGPATGNNAAAGQTPVRPQTGRSSVPQAPSVAPRTPLFPPRPND